ncbi:putative 2-oxoglutarate-dependent dioxygenase [Coleophoma cylindrospora]|uniref:Putative 2-oxoglutarate-dependent dioxygenase n=1 Tax=Coleophoma cylindrospora TaxID=1849047 RepID=A0A3D8QQ42_9HELO|nr:putative 2-oxoglutarate-dependent dioxygenase [Coleophoma cylindrospora]
MASSATSSPYIPVVDITPFLENPQGTAAQQVVDNVRRACMSTGFFLMKGHGISPKLQNSVFQASAKFFALPHEAKLSLDARKNVGFRGYDVMESQSYELETRSGPQDGSEVMRDTKEGFFASTDVPLDHPRVAAGRFLVGPNVWPDADVLSHEDFRAPLEEYLGEMKRLSHVVLNLIAATLPYGPHVFDELEADDPMCLLRLLHYPPTPHSVDGMKLGAGAHTDFGAITLLLQDEHPGLEVLDEKTGEWQGVPPQKDVYIVNMADIMSILTKGAYKSSVHRVWNKNTEDRYSVVFFFDGNLDLKLKPLDGTEQRQDNNQEILTLEEHVRGRMTGSYSIPKN